MQEVKFLLSSCGVLRVCACVCICVRVVEVCKRLKGQTMVE